MYSIIDFKESKKKGELKNSPFFCSMLGTSIV